MDYDLCKVGSLQRAQFMFSIKTFFNFVQPLKSISKTIMHCLSVQGSMQEKLTFMKTEFSFLVGFIH